VFQPFTPVKLKERRRPNWSIVLIAGLIVVLGIVGFRYFGSHKSPQHTGTPAAQDSHSSKPATTKPVVHTTPRHVRVTLVALPGSVSWAQLTSSKGHVIFQGDIGAVAGILKKTWIQKHPVTLQLGNPAAVHLYLNGKRQTYVTTTSITLTCTRHICK